MADWPFGTPKIPTLRLLASIRRVLPRLKQKPLVRLQLHHRLSSSPKLTTTRSQDTITHLLSSAHCRHREQNTPREASSLHGDWEIFGTSGKDIATFYYLESLKSRDTCAVTFYSREKAQAAFRALSEEVKSREMLKPNQAATKAFLSWAIVGWDPSNARTMTLKYWSGVVMWVVLQISLSKARPMKLKDWANGLVWVILVEISFAIERICSSIFGVVLSIVYMAIRTFFLQDETVKMSSTSLLSYG
jgi:hypothetical protein